MGLGLLGTTGCATAENVYGHTARYSPAFHGYVMAQKDGSDDPAPDDTVLLLRDPITGDKLQCREEVETWRELHEDLAEDLVADDNAAIAATVTATALFAPLVALHPVGALLVVEAQSTGDMIYDDARTATGRELFAHGISLFRRERFAQAIPILERALAKDGSLGVWDEALLYLGLSYSKTGDVERARLTLELFITRSGARDVDAYRTAEATLAKLGDVAPTCQSNEPVELHW